jgi:hypothetical protein
MDECHNGHLAALRALRRWQIEGSERAFLDQALTSSAGVNDVPMADTIVSHASLNLLLEVQ